MNCCGLALHNANLALYIAIGAFSTIALLLLMFFGYSLKLDKRTLKLEKKKRQRTAPNWWIKKKNWRIRK